jgi:prolyl oligopeptidase
MFDASGMRTEQFFAVSRDGTRVPYFVVWPKGVDSKMPSDGNTPTLLYGYGGFEVSMQPWYSAAYGSGWLERGGVFVVANIRGGGEFGPDWHKAAIREHKQRSYDDFIAVAEDLVKRQITSPRHLGIEGGSNGGLLMGAMFTQRPTCSAPSSARSRCSTCGVITNCSQAPRGWPSTATRTSPTTGPSSPSTARTRTCARERLPARPVHHLHRDDRVHPRPRAQDGRAHARAGHDVLYYENIEGGHGGAADNEQKSHIQALELSYLWQQLAR